MELIGGDLHNNVQYALEVMLLILLVRSQFGSQVKAQKNTAESNFTVIGHWPMGGCNSACVVGKRGGLSLSIMLHYSRSY